MKLKNAKIKKRRYKLMKRDEYQVATRIAAELILNGQSAGWKEAEASEEKRLAAILHPYNITPVMPRTWALNPLESEAP